MSLRQKPKPKPKTKPEQLPKIIRGFFIRGPVPCVWWSIARQGGMGAVAVASAIWRISGLRGRAATIELGNNEVELWGVTRFTKYRALKYLRDAGLITTKQLGNNTVEVTILCGDGSTPEGYEE
jgi:hypothetical protein